MSELQSDARRYKIMLKGVLDGLSVGLDSECEDIVQKSLAMARFIMESANAGTKFVQTYGVCE